MQEIVRMLMAKDKNMKIPLYSSIEVSSKIRNGKSKKTSEKKEKLVAFDVVQGRVVLRRHSPAQCGYALACAWCATRSR